jgi:pyruvyl transferase EpsO
MRSLKEKLNEILGYFDTTKRVVLYDYPLHLNVGDHLIQMGTERFFAENNIHVWKRYSVFDMPHSIRGMDDDVVIVCQGGGNFGDLWAIHQIGRETLLELYPRNPIVVLPQSVHFDSPDRLRQSMEAFRSHRNCHIFARDARSLEILRQSGIHQSCAMPDMAHYLWANLRPHPLSGFEEQPLQLIRRDRESRTSTIPPGLHEATPTFDWPIVLSRSTTRCSRLVIAAIRKQSKMGLHTQKYWQWKPMEDRMIRDGVRFLSRYRKIHTDRLHGTILGLLLEREVCAFDNSYGKLSSYREAWLSGMQGLTWEPEQ